MAEIGTKRTVVEIVLKCDAEGAPEGQHITMLAVTTVDGVELPETARREMPTVLDLEDPQLAQYSSLLLAQAEQEIGTLTVRVLELEARVGELEPQLADLQQQLTAATAALALAETGKRESEARLAQAEQRLAALTEPTDA